MAVMNEGVIQQWDTPVFPVPPAGQRFGRRLHRPGVLLPGTVLNSHQIEIELGVLDGVVDGDCSEEGGCVRCEQGCQVDVLIRPDDIIHDDDSLLMAEVERKAFRGADFIYTLRLPGGGRVLAQVDSHHNHAIGEHIGIRLGVDHVVAFSRMNPLIAGLLEPCRLSAPGADTAPDRNPHFLGDPGRRLRLQAEEAGGPGLSRLQQPGQAGTLLP